MENKSEAIKLLRTVGISTFITYFEKFKKGDKHNLENSFKNNNEKWNPNSKTTKINAGIKIFTEHLAIDALEYIINDAGENNIPDGYNIKQKAKEFYNDYMSKKEKK